ncbi:cell wall anchor protein [Marinirhabdus gelatinilytica]|uniref:Cell wall anchor protein n=1 Tax=Marinirhabdus gelatinilytica TaxID=1703343 RepID=A0A370QKR1_9FLAO|nr:cell wall anchor protein [Marinirhabdus gelatinilytica]RDK88901.1 hypothetical protein C8D94_101779 [Marinirhabdus gelatinilytica]
MFKYVTFFCSLIFIITTNAQVGIGTVTPDPSAAFEISSTDGGMLTPRMTTAQRTGISNPATGLLVFDTNVNSFYFFDGTTWQALRGAEIRDNYKLVKNISDLSEEFSGGTYTLQTGYLYEINGTIAVDAPIDLNGAYVEGVDVRDDILLNASGGTLFTGSTGGSMRNITISGNGNQIFGLTGGSLVVNNTLLTGASSVGTLNGMGLIFTSIVQLVNNTDGLTVSGTTGSFFMSNTFWTDTNSGTFLDLDGTYDNLQMANGRIVADASETGLDVSSNPTINNAALLSGLSFVGAGNFVEPYTTGTYPGYSFSVDWDVNCEGIPLETDANATGDLNFNFTAGGGANTIFTANQAPVKLNGATTSDNLFRFSRSGNNKIVYDGKKTRYFTVTASISFEGNTSQDRYIFYIAKGNSGSPTPTVLDKTGVWRRIGGAFDIGAVPLIGTVELSPGDYIEVWAERFSGSGSLFTVALNLAIR